MTTPRPPLIAPRHLPLALIIFSGALILLVNMGARQSFGFFLPPLSQKLGIGREAVGFAMGLVNLFWGLGSPVAGAIADRYGAGRVIIGGALMYTVGVYLLTQAGTATELAWTGVLIGCGISASGFSAVLGAVGRAAPPEKRQMALALASMGSAVGQFIALPYTHALIAGLGWSAALVALAATLLVMLPLSWCLSGPPRSVGTGPRQPLGDALREAFAHRGFWLLTTGFFVCGFHLAFVVTHLPAYFSDLGLPSWTAVAALATVGLTNVVGTFSTGKLGQLYEKRAVLSFIYLGRSLVFLAIIFVPLTPVTAIILFGALGFLWLSTVPLTSGLVATFFGPTWMSMLYGFVFISHQLGGFMGAWIGGLLYDVYGSYAIMWWMSVALGIGSALIHWPIVERPVPRLVTAAAE